MPSPLSSLNEAGYTCAQGVQFKPWSLAWSRLEQKRAQHGPHLIDDDAILPPSRLMARRLGSRSKVLVGQHCLGDTGSKKQQKRSAEADRARTCRARPCTGLSDRTHAMTESVDIVGARYP